MVERADITLIDDLDGGVADYTCQFGLDGKRYEIELSAANYQKLQEAFAPFVARGRRIPTMKKRKKRRHK